MALNKQQLEVVNQTNFPDNNDQLITPELLRDFNTDMIDAIQLTGSYATTGSNTFVGNQTITGNLNVSGVISASVLYVQTETASVIYSSGSNQFGDELSDTQTLSGSVKVQGSLTVNGVAVLTSSVDISGLVTTASFNAYTSSNNQRVSSLEANTASVNTSITNLNSFTASQSTLNGTFATTGSNTFTGNQIIDKTKALYTNALYWSSSEVGYTNLEIINQAGGNLDFASLNGGKMRIVSTPLILTGSAISSSNDISTSANIYGANITGSTINTGSLVTTASFNAYTQSNDTIVSALVVTTNAQQTLIGNLNVATASLFSSASLALTTASFAAGTLTFTKGNGTTFGVVIPDISGSTIPAGTVSGSAQIVALGFATTASLNAYTASTDSSISQLNASSASQQVSINALNTNSASVNVSISNLNSTTSSFATSISNLNSNSASVNTSITNLNASSASQQVSIDALNTFTASQSTASIVTSINNLNTFSASALVSISNINSTTASLNTSVSNLNTFTGSQLTINSGVNTFTSSANQRLGSLETNSASVNTSISALNTFTASQSTASLVTSITNLNTFSASTLIRLTNIESTTASLNTSITNLNLSSASQQVSIDSINSVSSSWITESETGSFARTDAANLFTADQTIASANNLIVSGSLISLNGLYIPAGILNTSITFSSPNSTLRIDNASLNVDNTFTASLQEGYVWVGNSTGRTTTVATSSFAGGGGTGSVPAGTVSSSAQILNYGIFATTGSNTFVGNQTITSTGNTQINIESTGGPGSNQTNLEFRGNSSNFQAYGDFVINNNGQFGGSGSVRIIATKNNLSIATDDGLKIGATNGGGNGIDNGNISMQVRSGSLSLAPSGVSNTTASLAHLSSSSNTGNVNLVFKNNSTAGDTIISGSNNIFTNPAAVTAGYKRYIGGSNNLYLNSTNGINSQITASAVSVSGVRPVMNNNIFNGTGNFSINQATNPGTHTYSQNIIGGTSTTTINALGFTGSLNLLSNLNCNGTITINAASASIAEIATGISGSGTVTVNNNLNLAGTITVTSPHRLLTTNTQTITGNILAGGVVTVTNISSSAQVVATGNIGSAAFIYSNAGAAGLGLHTGVGSMGSNIGGMNLIASASAIQAGSNISPASMAVTNRMFSGSLGLGVLNFNNNQTQGATNTYTVSGSYGGTSNTTGPAMQGNGIFGSVNTIFTNVEGRGNYVDFRSNLVGGHNLILTGSNNNAITASGGGYFGRFNADDGLRNTTGENILVVGTGTSATTRKTGFLIDSGSNTFIEGTLNVSGSTTMTGSLILSSSNATELFVIGDSQFTGSVKVASTFQLQLPTGSNQQAGTAVLDGGNPGTVTVSNSLVTANSIIMLTKQSLTNAHMVAVSSKGAGTFTITSNGNGDADTVGWFIINNS